MTARSLAVGCGIAAALVLVVGGCGLAVTIASLPSGDHPEVDFTGDGIARARSEVVPGLEAELDGVEARYGARRVGPRLRIDRCEPGQDNFTRQDRYAYVCTMQIAQLMPVREPVEAEASRLGEALLEGDCPNGTDTDRALAEPGDDPRLLDVSSGACPPEASFSPEIVRWISIPATERDVRLAEIYLRSRCRTASAPPEYCESDLFDLRALAAAAPADAAYMAIVVADAQYATIPWDCPWPASWLREHCRA